MLSTIVIGLKKKKKKKRDFVIEYLNILWLTVSVFLEESLHNKKFPEYKYSIPQLATTNYSDLNRNICYSQ